MFIEAIFVISLIISVAFQVDAVAANKMAQNKQSEITKQATQIAKDISKDQALVSKLLTAWQKKDTDLASELLYSSPFGTRIMKLRNAKDNASKKVDELNKEAINLQNEAAKHESEAQKKASEVQSSGSAVVDLISGSAHVDPNLDSYQSKNYDQYKI